MTNESIPPFFTLMAEEINPLAMICVTMTDALMKDPVTQKTASLSGDFLEGFNRLRDRINGMQDEEGNFVPADIPLDVHESFAMMHSIVQPFYKLKGHITLPKEQRNPISEEQEAEIERVYYELKDQAADILLRLTKLFNYDNYGLQTLEEVFDIKAAERPLPVDNKKVVSTIIFNETNTKLFSFMFSFFDYLEFDKEKYDFASKFYSCRFIHINDYKALKDKLFPQKKRKKVNLTLRDNISLFYMLNLFGRLFLSDAAKCFEEVGKQAESNSDKSFGNNPVAVPTEQAAQNLKAIGIEAEAGTSLFINANHVRNFMLKFGDQFIADMRNHMKGLPEENKVFEEYIKRIDSWDTLYAKLNDA